MEFGTYQLANIPFERQQALESVDAIDYLGQPGGRNFDEYGQWYPILKPSAIFGTRNSRQWGRNRYSFWTELQLCMQRDAARFLADNDPLAAGVLGQLVNFTVGDEAQVTISPKKGRKSDQTQQAAQLVQARVDALKERIAAETGYTLTFEEWCREYCLTAIIDGEKYDRIFCQKDGAVPRRVEPEQVRQPPGGTEQDGWHLGVKCEPGDVTKRQAFYVTYAPGENLGEIVSARDLLQYKRNTVSTVVRGVSDFLPVTDDLADIGRLIDGIRVGSKIKAKIAYIRSLKGVTQASVEDFVRKVNDNAPPPNPYTAGSGRNNLTRETMPPGAIINAGDNMDVKTLPQGATQEYLAAANFCIRVVLGMRWQLPEYMVNSDASNNNYASIMVSGGPSVRAFKANQSAIAARIRLIVKRVLEYDMMLGFLPLGILSDLDILVRFQSPVISDPLEDAQVKSIELERKVRSRKSWQMASGLDPDEEDGQILEDQEKFGTMASPLPELLLNQAHGQQADETTGG